ncbi:type I glutamate--ammonia ligase [bacterium]|nr:type I glutamate--ammonia ligase [bacterium]
MFNSPEGVLDYLSRKKIKGIDFKFSDLLGKWHHVTVPASTVKVPLLVEGIGIDGSSLPGFKGVEAGDMIIIPDLETGFEDPFWQDSTLSFICSIHEAESGKPFSLDPRSIALKTEDYTEQQDIGKSLWLPELEFYLLQEADFSVGKGYSHYSLESAGDHSQYSLPCGLLQNSNFYHQIPPADHFFNIRAEIVNLLESAAIPVKYHHHEAGAMGQMEIELDFMPLVKTCDAIMIAKYFVRMVARKNGLKATFMPKPFLDEPGNGLHFHQYLERNKKSLFYGNEYANLSKLALQYLAGLIVNTPSLLAFTNPSTNSFKRLVPGFEAPTRLFFGEAHRSATVRIPKYSNNPEKKRFEYRPGDATCNPYLAVSAMLLAGLQGIDQKMDPQAMGFGPVVENIDKWTRQKLDQLKSIPCSLESALQHLKMDNTFLTQNGMFSETLINTWIQLKTQDIDQLNKMPNPLEMTLYFDL